MSFIRQFILSVAALGGAFFLWVTYVPSAAGYLERFGVLDALGIEINTQKEDASQGGGFGRGGPTQVIVAEVELRTMGDRVTAIGDGRALRSVTVRSEAVGLITDIRVEAGSYVNDGDVIVTLENEAETIARDRARIILEDARDEAERLSRLQTTGAVTQVRLREGQLALRTAELGLREAEFDLTQRTIRAPISGWIGLLDIEEGDRVLAQDAFATITDRSYILIDFRVPERVIGQLEIGSDVDVTPLGLRNTVLTGQISALDTVVDRASRTMRVRARVPNEDDRLRAGMAFSVALDFEGETLHAVEPLSVQWSGSGAYVWAVRNGRAQQVPVTIRQRNSDSVLVEAELEEGEQIVTEGVQFLRPGAEVSVANQVQAATPHMPTPRQNL